MVLITILFLFALLFEDVCAIIIFAKLKKLMASKKKEYEKHLYLTPELSQLFDAYTFSRYKTTKRRKNRTGNFIVNSFFQSMPAEKRKQLIADYDTHRKEQGKVNDDRN